MSARVPEDLVRVVEALRDDANLGAWFARLAQMPPGARVKELIECAGRMRAGGEELELIRAIALLAEPCVFEAVEGTLIELLKC